MHPGTLHREGGPSSHSRGPGHGPGKSYPKGGALSPPMRFWDLRFRVSGPYGDLQVTLNAQSHELGSLFRSGLRV